MAFTYFVVPVDYPQAAQEELNVFLATQRVVTVTQHLITTDGAARWAVCVETTAQQQNAGKAVTRGERKDYKEILNAGDFATFAELRVLRKTLAAKNGVPPYAVFTDAQLAALVTGRVVTKKQLAAVDGIGEARLRDFGDPVLELLRRLMPGGDS